MFAIIGAAGNVGYSTSSALRRAGVPVRAILSDAAKAARLSELGCEIALADLQDAGALAQAIGDADTVQIVVPRSPQAKRRIVRLVPDGSKTPARALPTSDVPKGRRTDVCYR